ncbi:hypothetical protein D3C79_731400 [compost metagenome]
MNEREIQIVGAQLLQAGLEAGNELALTKFAGPHLGGQVDIAAGHRGRGQHLAHFGLVVVDLGGIDVAIAELQAGIQGGEQRLGFQAEGPQTHGRHFHHHVP